MEKNFSQNSMGAGRVGEEMREGAHCARFRNEAH